MAAAKSVEKLEKELCCAVCMQVLTSPRHLSSCDHTFCEKCLEMVISSEGEANSRLKCPMCRKTSTLPGKGVSGLKSDPLTCGILEVLKTKLDSSKKGCDSCGDTETPLITYCRDCFEFICQSCTESHERMKLKYTNHRTVLLSDINNGKVKVSPLEDSEKRNPSKCAEHWELMSYYCKTCKLRICRDCVVLEHNGHDCTTLRHIFNEMQKEIGRLRDRCQQQKEEMEWSMNKVEKKERAGAAKTFQEMRESTAAATLAAMSYLKEAEEQLLAKVGKLERAFKRNVKLSRDHVSGITDNIERVVSQADSILVTNEAPEFSALPDDLIKKMEELLAKESKVAAVDDILALKGTSIQSHHLSLTMSSYADVVLSGVWQVKSTLKLDSKSSASRVFCNNSHVILQTRGNVYKRPLDGQGSGWNDKLLSVQNNQSVAEVAVSFQDQVMYISFRDNLELGIRMVQLSEINGRNGNYSSFENMKSVTPSSWSTDTEMMTTDCKGRIIYVGNQMGQTPPFSTLSKSPPDKIQRTANSAGATFTGYQASAVPVQTSYMSTCLTGSPTLTMGIPGSGLSSPDVRKKVLGTGRKTSTSITTTEQKTHFAGKNAFSFQSATVYRHRPNKHEFQRSYHDPQSDSFEVPFGVASVAAAKTGQLAFLREDKKGVIITDEDGRIQHEIKEPGRMYLSISCTESDALYVLSSSCGSRTFTLTKHSLDDGGLLEYVIDQLDASDGVTVDERQIMSNYGNDRVIVIVGKEIRIYSRKEWRVIDDYDNYLSDDSDL
ncbi:uncharacterized protein LOC105442550 [Strongylocentrotus purpuratus]|uniref:Uncharacterized protein n=1 Tax=Strongylocentrotus purpuratus TaxID=7668 RepID=A0A7M7HG36_STRPU|nr:uncharacterized protein LOC105442550 [Strongylocentrotus purpuratus]